MWYWYLAAYVCGMTTIIALEAFLVWLLILKDRKDKQTYESYDDVYGDHQGDVG